MKFLSEKLLVIIIVVVLAGLAYIKFFKPGDKVLDINIPKFKILDGNQSSEPDKTVLKDDLKTLVAKVGQLFELPTNEAPSIATITDINKLKDQPFFAKGQNGDRVLIYSQAKWAIIYRPSTNKIVEAGSVEISTESESSGSDSADLINSPVSTQRKVLIQEKLP